MNHDKLSPGETEILQLTQRLLEAIAAGDWETYVELCGVGMTAIEPEASGQVVIGLPFHKFYFDLGGIRGPHQITIAAPRVQLLGDAAVIAYTRLIQQLDASRTPKTTAFEETRVWHRQDGKWKQVHFHRSKVSTQ